MPLVAARFYICSRSDDSKTHRYHFDLLVKHVALFERSDCLRHITNEAYRSTEQVLRPMCQATTKHDFGECASRDGGIVVTSNCWEWWLRTRHRLRNEIEVGTFTFTESSMV